MFVRAANQFLPLLRQKTYICVEKNENTTKKQLNYVQLLFKFK